MKFLTFDEDSRFSFGKKVVETTGNKSALSSFLLGKRISMNDIPALKEYKCVQEFFDLPMHDTKETSLKKAFASAVVIAQKKNILPFKIDGKPEEIAANIDEGLTRAKLAYKVSKGEVDIIDAANYLIDKKVSQLATVAKKATDKFIDKGWPVVTKVITGFLASNPYTAPIAPIANKVLHFAKPIVKNIVRKGVDILAKYAAPICKKACETVIKACKSVTKSILSIFSW